MLAHILLIVIQQNMDDPWAWIWIIAFLVAAIGLLLAAYWWLTSPDKPVIPRKRLIDEIDFSSYEKKGGGMAEVYICDDPWNPGRKVVVKFPRRNIKPDHQFTINYRFCNEIKHHQKLEYPNIVRFLEHGECKHPFSERKTLYLIQEFIDGCTLKEMIDGRRSALSQAIIFEVTTQILDALEYIYSQKVIHRDLSWNNIMLDRTGRLYLIDFGNSTTLEQLLTDIASGNSSKTIHTVVPPHPFEAPHDIEDTRNTRARDLYALAMLVYLMYGGSFPHNNGPADVRKQVKKNLEEMSNVPDHVRETLKDCLEGNSRTVLELRANLCPLRDQLGQMVQNIVNPDPQAATKVIRNPRDQNTTHSA
ncbi:MAG: serine/threonine protein kinase [Ardenticatenaceae bacterium]